MLQGVLRPGGILRYRLRMLVVPRESCLLGILDKGRSSLHGGSGQLKLPGVPLSRL